MTRKASDYYKTPRLFNTLLENLWGNTTWDCAAAADGQHTIDAERYITEEENFLAMTPMPREWKGIWTPEPVRAFMNPPFSDGYRFINHFALMYANEVIEQGAVLCLSGVLHNKKTREAVDRAAAFCLWNGRMAFESGHVENLVSNGFDRDVILMYYGAEPRNFAKVFYPYGRVLIPYLN